ncbi:MAG TPA: ABC transporter substrate-binding protein [Burkholderiales bacterium]|nr:ABC transporter substrate-binding protein [Burkholderiales bacterium]
MKISLRVLLAALMLVLAGCTNTPWNDPYPSADTGKNILYTAFTERPKQLDPAKAYNENEFVILANVYEPPLQYHYLKRPYQLIPFGATEVPQPQYFDAQHHPLPDNADPQKIAYSVYTIHVRHGMYYQPTPALATDAHGHPLYLDLKPGDLADIRSPADFKHSGTREVTAADYVYEIKRLAYPRLVSPIYGLMGEYIVGLKALSAELAKAQEKHGKAFLDLTQYKLPGARVIDRYTYQITIRGKYPQFVYWLAMPFFAPVPPEADRFYSQPGMAEHNLTLDWYPVGSGPYMLTVNDPNRVMVLKRNPYYARQGETYPSRGAPGDAAAGLLRDAGKPLPLTGTVVFSLEKEAIPYWTKFLQGYYDVSGIGSDVFDQAVQFSGANQVSASPAMRKRDIRLQTSVAPSIFYMGFNMLDPVLGGLSDRARKLRQAISIAINEEEFISIFLNGRGIPAQGPIPPGIFGHRDGKAGIDPYVYDWVNGAPRRKSIAYAKKLLAEAGYPDGRDAKTGEPLLIHLDTTSNGLGDKSRIDWLVKQFHKIDLQLVVRSTDYNRFQDKMAHGNAQLFFWGWNADYPDPENFLFLLYGPNGRVKYGGPNSANYDNPEFNALFEKMKNMDNGPERQAIIDKMIAIARRDAPWVWGFYPKTYALVHGWVYNRKPNPMANNGLKYQRVDPQARVQYRERWNHPVLWPLALLALLLIVLVTPAIVAYRRRERAQARRRPLRPAGVSGDGGASA